jgi:hypothetical protein
MDKYMWSASATPGKAFRGVVFSGIEWDAKGYSTRGANGEEPSELEIMSSIIIIERDDAQAAYKAATAAKKKADDDGRAENEAAEVQLGLRGGPGLITPSPTTNTLGNNPTSLFGGGISSSRGSRAGEISLCMVILLFISVFNSINHSFFIIAPIHHNPPWQRQRQQQIPAMVTTTATTNTHDGDDDGNNKYSRW